MYIKVGEAWIENVFRAFDEEKVGSVMLTSQEEKAGQITPEDLPFLRNMFGHNLEFYDKEVKMVKR